MARSNDETERETDDDAEPGETPEQAQMRRRRNKASRIRKRIEAGKEVQDEQRAFVAAYDAEIEARRIERERAMVASQPAADPAPVSPSPDPSPPTPSPESDPRPAAPPPTQAAPAAPAAPKPEPKARRALAPVPALAGGVTAPGAHDWLAEFGGGPGGARREMCVELAELVQGFQTFLYNEIVESEGRPMFDPRTKDNFNVLVRAANDLAPSWFVVTPPIRTGVVTTTLMLQRVLRGGKLKELRKKRAAELEAAKRRAGADAPAPAQPAPEPVREPDSPKPGQNGAPAREPLSASLPSKLPEGFRGPIA